MTTGGRAAWNVVTSPDAFTGENFRRSGYLERAGRYVRAAEFAQAARVLWESWPPDAVAAGDSDGGREFAAHSADAIFTRHSAYDAGRVFYTDVKSRLPGASFVLGDTSAQAQEHARHIRRQRVSPQTAILLLEQVWNTDLSGFDPEGPLPPFDPDPRRSRSRSTPACRTTPATGSSSCRT